MNNTQFSIRAPNAGVTRLCKAILFYGSGGGNATPEFATVHDVQNAGGAPVILPGKAARPSDALKLVRTLSKAKPIGFIPPELLYHDGLFMMWWVPPAVRPIVFAPGALGSDEVRGDVPQPGLVFLAKAGGGWSVWAVKGRKRPTLDGALFRAPYLNVYDSGAICAGSVRLPKEPKPDEIGCWNDAFFLSRFTHANSKQKLIKYEGGIMAFWRAVLDGAFKRHFPTKLLMPVQAKLSDLIGNISRA